MPEAGRVHLVGAGPGGAGALPRRAEELLSRAEAILHDADLLPEVLDLCPPGAERRQAGAPTSSGGFLIERARAGKRVVRLYRDDPFASGLGVEDARRLAKEGIPFEVVPGLNLGVAAPTFAGIPLAAGGFAVVYDEPAEGRDLGLSRFLPAVKGGGVLVVVTAAGRMERTVEALSAAGFPPDTPLAAIGQSGSPAQRVVEAHLEDAQEALREAALAGQVVMVLGEGSRLRRDLSWFEERPLHGRRVLITRPKEQAGELARHLRELGAEPLLSPAIRILPPEDWAPLDAALDRLDSFDWIIFTSANGVRFFARRLRERGMDPRRFGCGCRVIAIGPGTAREMEEALRIQADAVPRRFVAEGILEALEGEELGGKRVLIPRALEAREVLPEGLRRRGAHVEVVPAYRTLRAEDGDVERIRAEFAAGRIDMVAFTSSSTVRHFLEMLGGSGFRDMMSGVGIASIGPVTSDTVLSYGFRPSVEAEESTVWGLAQAIADHYLSA